MKKLLLVSGILLLVACTIQAQDVLEKAKSAVGSGFNASSLTESISSLLKTKLNLSDSQYTKVSKAVNTFLESKAEILPLKATDSTEYNQHHESLFSKLKTTFSGILLKNQLNKFLSLKPAVNDPADLLSNIFY